MSIETQLRQYRHYIDWPEIAVLACLIAGASAGLWKLFIVSTTALTVMLIGARVATPQNSSNSPLGVIWSYGVASGMMIASAGVFLLPKAMTSEPTVGGIGVIFGVLIGFTVHTLGHRLTHKVTAIHSTTAELTVHSVVAGVFMGLLYGSLPSLSLLLGLSIISHKLPAGYVGGTRLINDHKSVSEMKYPAFAVALTALPIALVVPQSATGQYPVLFGIATGVFFHVALDFLPQCEVGSDVYSALERLGADAHATLDEYRTHAVLSTVSGAGSVLILRFFFF